MIGFIEKKSRLLLVLTRVAISNGASYAEGPLVAQEFGSLGELKTVLHKRSSILKKINSNEISSYHVFKRGRVNGRWEVLNEEEKTFLMEEPEKKSSKKAYAKELRGRNAKRR